MNQHCACPAMRPTARVAASVLSLSTLLIHCEDARAAYSALNAFPVGSTLSDQEQVRKYKIIGSRDPAFPLNTYASLRDLAADGAVLAIDKSECT